MSFTVYADLAGEDIVLALAAPNGVGREAKTLATLCAHVTEVKGMDPNSPMGTVPLSWATVVQLRTQLRGALTMSPALTEWVTAELVARMADYPEVFPGWLRSWPEYRLAAEDTHPPREYQWQGAYEIARTGRCLVMDDPGTGKTLSAILGVLAMRAKGEVKGAVLVIAPNSVMDSWVEAWTRWTHLTAKAWRGAPARRKAMAGLYDVYVAGYGTVRKDADGPLSWLNADAVIIDECHAIKNRDATQSKAVRKLAKSARVVIPMSGTPITHHPGDLFASFQAMDARTWTSYERFTERYLLQITGDYGRPEVLRLDPGAEPEFRDVLTGVHRRVAKADVLTQLPPKIYTTRSVELPGAYRRAYVEMEQEMLANLPDGEELPVMTALAQLQRLNQLSASACDVSTEVVIEPDQYGVMVEKVRYHVTPKAPSWKAEAMVEVLAERPGRQSVVFSPSAGLIRVAAAYAIKAGYRVGLIIGGQSARARTATVTAFQDGELDVVLATTGAGGVGLTLTAADTVIFLQRPWSWVEASQAEDRAHRIGSEIHNAVEIVDIVATDTVDSRVREVLTGKAQSLADLLQDQRIASQAFGGEVHTTFSHKAALK